MDVNKLLELLHGAGIDDLRYTDVDEEDTDFGYYGDNEWKPRATEFKFRLDWEYFSNLIVMHRVVTALLAAGCKSCRVVEKESGSDDDVIHRRELVMEFPL